ncbi:MAG: hypothetical protein M3R41_04195 [Pseudomonadota bacterium]|nr:hypothetical protein [Pseudomonadota bacterium]
MTLGTDDLRVAFEIDINGEKKRLEMDGLSIIPRVGEIVECNYVHGTRASFEVTEVYHHVSNIGHKILQQITVRGAAA